MSDVADKPSWVVVGPDDLAAMLRDARKEAGWTQQELADAAGIHRSYLSDLEQGHTAEQVRRLLRLVRALDLEVTVSARRASELMVRNDDA